MRATPALPRRWFPVVALAALAPLAVDAGVDELREVDGLPSTFYCIPFSPCKVFRASSEEPAWGYRIVYRTSIPVTLLHETGTGGASGGTQAVPGLVEQVDVVPAPATRWSLVFVPQSGPGGAIDVVSFEWLLAPPAPGSVGLRMLERDWAATAVLPGTFAATPPETFRCVPFSPCMVFATESPAPALGYRLTLDSDVAGAFSVSAGNVSGVPPEHRHTMAYGGWDLGGFGFGPGCQTFARPLPYGSAATSWAFTFVPTSGSGAGEVRVLDFAWTDGPTDDAGDGASHDGAC